MTIDHTSGPAPRFVLRDGIASLKFEGTMSGEVLRACPRCGEPHPQTRGSASLKCLSCGAKVAAPEGFSADSVVLPNHDPRLLWGRFLLFIGRMLHRFAKEV